MKLKTLYSTLPLAVLALMTAACSDDDDYRPGTPTAADTPALYFEPETPSSFFFQTGQSDYSLDITVYRAHGDDELTVPVKVLYAAPALIIPQDITFEAGQNSTLLTLNIAGEQNRNGVRYDFALTFPDQYLDNYSATLPGIGRVQSAAIVADPEIAICSADTFYDELGGDSEMKFMRLSDTEFYFPDFFNTGQPMTITVDPSSYDISITSTLGYYSDDYQDYVIEDYPVYMGGSAATTYISYMLIYYPGYSYYYQTEDQEGICLSVFMMLADGSEDYDYIYIDFPIETAPVQ